MIKKTLPFFLLAVLFTSCSLLGLNMKRKAPKKQAAYPAFTEKDSLKGKLSDNRAAFDVFHYGLDITFDIPGKSISGVVVISLEALRDLDSIQLDLSKKMNLREITFEGRTLKANREFQTFFVLPGRRIKKGEKISLQVRYDGKPEVARRPPWEGGFVWTKDKEKNPWVAVACEHLGASSWWPLKDHLSDEPDSADIKLTVPKGLYAVSNGTLTDRSSRDGTSETFHWKISYPINTYNITFYIGDYAPFSLPYEDEKKHELYFFPLKPNLERAKEHFRQAVDVVRTFEKIYGEYPFWRDGYKLVESPFAGMEHQTAIAYGNGYKNNYSGIDYIILHETAHEWWGNAISVKDYADIWIHEGMATYSEALYVEQTGNYITYLNYLYFYSLLIQNKKPMVGPRDVNYWNYKDGDPYMKGALMMHNLRATISDDSLFFDIIRSFYNRYKYKTVTSADFINLVNEKTKADYGWFFKQFLYNRKPPKLSFEIIPDPTTENYMLYYKWTDTDPDFKMPVSIRVAGKEILLHPTGEEQFYELKKESGVYFDAYAFYYTMEREK